VDYIRETRLADRKRGNNIWQRTDCVEIERYYSLNRTLSPTININTTPRSASGRSHEAALPFFEEKRTCCWMSGRSYCDWIILRFVYDINLGTILYRVNPNRFVASATSSNRTKKNERNQQIARLRVLTPRNSC
jgi:hypothetical protein